MISGDDIYDKEDILKLSKTPAYGVLAKAVDNPQDFGIFSVDQEGIPTGIIEKPVDPGLGNLANIGVFQFDDTIFSDLLDIPLSPR